MAANEPNALSSLLAMLAQGGNSSTLGGVAADSMSGINWSPTLQPIRDKLKSSGGHDLSGHAPRPNYQNPYGGGSAGMSISGGQSDFDRGLAQEGARSKMGLRDKARNLDLERKYSNLAMQDKLNAVRQILGKMMNQKDVMQETAYERQAGEMTPYTKTTTRNRDYTSEILKMLGM